LCLCSCTLSLVSDLHYDAPRMNRRFIGLVILGAFLLAPQVTIAIPPPDLIANIGSQFAQIFSLMVVLLGAGAGAIYQYLRRFFKKLRGRGIWVIFAALSVVVLALVGTYSVILALQTKVENDYEQEVAEVIDAGIAQYDALQASTEAPVNFLESADPNVRFIAQYYDYLGTGQLSSAYAVSKKSVSYATYASWYELVTKTEVEAIESIGDNEYSVRVSLFEDDAVTIYGVLMTLGAGVIADSEVRIISADEAGSFAEAAELEGSFFAANSDLPIAISNDDFEALSSQGPFVLDAREDEEYELGYYPGSTHIRFADLLAGSWVSLPTDEVVYVLCWSGIRGKELAEFLREKGIVARYLEDGASGWVEDGGEWEGEILFSSKYNDERYTGTFSTSEVHDYVEEGVVLVDARRQDVFADSHITGSLNITIFFTPSDELELLFAQVPPRSSVITICDDYVSCFDAKIAGVKLEKLGHIFLGRYTSPSDY
jgi:rhodanese-related sulfurtransferase